MTRPPFRADHVGSLLRPAEVTEARAQFKAGAIDDGRLREIEEHWVSEVAKKQESVGLKGITDGEYRRDYWHLDFVSQLDGVKLVPAVGQVFQAAGVPPMASITGKVDCSKGIFLETFRHLKTVTGQIPKLTIPAPATLHFRGGRNAIAREVYPDLKQFWIDVGNAYQKAIAHLAEAGCTYLQLDDVSFSYLCDPKVLDNFRANGDDPATLGVDYADAINRALANRPPGMTVTMHTCRGNFRSTWFASGAYRDAVIETMFSANVDGYFMEYDSDRAGGFEPLRLLPKGKRVVLGLVSSKLPALESKDALKRRIDEAAKYVPLENLCLSPQCGFASTHHGNQLTQDEQWRKLERVVEVAREVWGEI